MAASSRPRSRSSSSTRGTSRMVYWRSRPPGGAGGTRRSFSSTRGVSGLRNTSSKPRPPELANPCLYTPQASSTTLARLGHQKCVPAQQDRRKVDRDRAPHTVFGDPKPRAVGDRLWKRQKPAGGGAFDEGYVVPRLDQVPEAGELAGA